MLAFAGNGAFWSSACLISGSLRFCHWVALNTFRTPTLYSAVSRYVHSLSYSCFPIFRIREIHWIFWLWPPLSSICLQRRDVYGAWEQYLGLEHSDTAPKRAYTSNQVNYFLYISSYGLILGHWNLLFLKTFSITGIFHCLNLNCCNSISSI